MPAITIHAWRSATKILARRDKYLLRLRPSSGKVKHGKVHTIRNRRCGMMVKSSQDKTFPSNNDIPFDHGGYFTCLQQIMYN